MNFKVHVICGKLIEVTVDSVETGTLDEKEASEVAREFLRVAEELAEFASMLNSQEIK